MKLTCLKITLFAAVLFAEQAVANTCSVALLSSGNMTVSPDYKKLDSKHADASPGTMSVFCDTSGTIIIENPVPVGTAAQNFWASLNYGASIAQNGTTYVTIQKGGTSTSASISSGVYQVHAWISNTSAFVPGNYAVTVTASIVPN